MLRDVFDEEGLALQCGLTGDAPAELDAHPFDFSGVADLEAHAEVAAAFVDEEDGEDLVVDHSPDEICDPVHESVQVEGSVEGVGEVVKEVDLEGFDTNFRVCGVWMKELRRGRSVVAFEVVFLRGRGGAGG